MTRGLRKLQRAFLAAIVTATAAGPTFSQATKDQPTRQEVERAYMSKISGDSTVFPRIRWERWETGRIKEIRGWSIRFKRVGEEKWVGVRILRYRAVAKKGGTCAEYRVSDTFPLLAMDRQEQRNIAVEAVGLASCR